MKMFTIAALLLLAAPSIANAQEAFQPDWYGSFHVGTSNVSWVQGDQDFSFFTLGGSLSYRHSESVSTDLYASISLAGERDEITSNIVGTDVDANYHALGVFLAFQNPGRFYVKGRVGMAASIFQYSADGYEPESQTDMGLGYGFGVGMNADNVRVELEYISMPEVDDPLFNDTSYEAEQIVLSFGSSF